jgi:hypothetical protein
VYAAIGLQKLICELGAVADGARGRLDIVQLDLYTAFVLCCSLLTNGAPFTFARAWCMVVVAAICELQEVFGTLTWATELGTGRLPFRVLLLWVMIHTPCHELVRLLGARNPLAVASLTALLMTLADLTTDPLYASPKLAGNVVMKLWHWAEPTSRADRRVYGVPIKNFLWWWAAGFIATLLIEILSNFGKAPRVRISRSKLWSVLQCCGLAAQWRLLRNAARRAARHSIHSHNGYDCAVVDRSAQALLTNVEWRAPEDQPQRTIGGSEIRTTRAMAPMTKQQ